MFKYSVTKRLAVGLAVVLLLTLPLAACRKQPSDEGPYAAMEATINTLEERVEALEAPAPPTETSPPDEHLHPALEATIHTLEERIAALEAAAPPPESPEAEPTPSSQTVVHGAGVAIGYEYQMDGDLARGIALRPIDAMWAFSRYNEFGNNDEIRRMDGRVEMALIRAGEDDEESYELFLTAPLVGITITPTIGIPVTATTWSEYTAILQLTEVEDGEPMGVSTLAMGPRRTIKQPPNEVITSPGPTIQRSLLDLELAGVDVLNAKWLLLALEIDGETKRVLVLIEPGSGAGCDFVPTYCGPCDSLFCEGACVVLEIICP